VEKGMMAAPGANRRVQVRKVREGGFTEDKKQIFLDHLAGCCNVTHAARAAGVSVKTVNNHRRRDPCFARQCDEALAVGYDNLDAALVAAAARGGHYEPGPASDAMPGQETLDKDLALHLLRLRRLPMGQRSGVGGHPPLKRASEKELNDAILALLDVLERRLRKKGGRGSGAPD
jgi:hypothetical protein